MGIPFEDRRAELDDAIRAAEPNHRRFDYLQSIYRNGTAIEALRSHVAANRGMVTVNIAFANIRALVALTLPPRHRITAKSEREADEPLLPIAQQLESYAWRKLHVKDEVRRCQYDAGIFGIGFCKVGFGSEFGVDQKTVDSLQSFSEALARAVGMIEAKRTKNDPFRKGKGDMAVEFNPNVRSAMPWAIRISPYCVYPDPMVDRIENGRYLFLKIVRSLDDVRRDPKYTNTDRLQPDGYLNPMFTDPVSRQQQWRDNPAGFQVIDSSNFDGASGDTKRTPIVTLFECWDKRDNTYSVVSAQRGVDGYLREPMDWPYPQLGKFPVFDLSFNVSPDEPWPVGEIEPIWRNQQELNHIRTIMLEHVRRCVQHRPLAPMSATDDELSNLVNPDYVKIIRTADPTMWGDVDFGDLKPEAYNVGSIVEQDILQISGLSANQRGAATDSTATESSIIETNVQLQTEQRRQQVKDFVSGILGGHFAIWRNAISPDQLIEICGDEAIGKVIATDLEKSVGTFDFELELQDAVASNLAVQRSQLIETINLVAQLKAQQIIPEANVHLLVKKLLEISDITEIDKILPDEPELPNLTDMQMMGMDPSMQGMQNPSMGEDGGAVPFDQGGGGLTPDNTTPGEETNAAGLASEVGGQPNLKRGRF